MGDANLRSSSAAACVGCPAGLRGGPLAAAGTLCVAVAAAAVRRGDCQKAPRNSGEAAGGHAAAAPEHAKAAALVVVVIIIVVTVLVVVRSLRIRRCMSKCEPSFSAGRRHATGILLSTPSHQNKIRKMIANSK